MPNLNLVNQPSLDKILKAEVFVHIDDQLRAAYLILDYVPISKSFLVLKCAIKARNGSMLLPQDFYSPALFQKVCLPPSPYLKAYQG